ncbi:DUF2169 family type VI secretion system accessory protein [Caballeronia telluris]|uniref:DUF2169 domain-containing protein n=1 Tax=Caballeronia telluris TaxID=326475 RepID=A0A158FV73_9BURK|nr:DUF2169 domain-containing protein [Caballeronia telluris]SAL23756.1 hypothetical protein AWB66_01282 [Caballeronia telluris]
MELINATRMVAGYTMGTEPSGRESLIVVVKGTFRLPAPGEAVRLAEEQLPLVMADTFTGQPGYSAPYYEVDYAPHKPRCDVLLSGSAHAPGGRPATRVPVGLRVGNMTKQFAVIGDRVWQAGATRIDVSAPVPFVSKPITYDVAFGGVDQEHDDPMQHAAFMANPVGRGFRRHLRRDWVDGRLLPNTEELNRPVMRPDEVYRPMSFGVVGRGWTPRLGYAGTYDDEWLEKHFPFLPPDFDERYYSAAPEDQQLAMPVGGVEVRLVNLTPDGKRSFVLPDFEAPVLVLPKRGEPEDYRARVDTIVFEPELERFTMSWRVRRPLKKNMFEIARVLVGRKGREWWQQKGAVPFPMPVIMVPMERSETTP